MNALTLPTALAVVMSSSWAATASFAQVSSQPAGQIRLRSGATASAEGEPVSLSIAGVVVRDANGTRTVSWDQVAGVDGPWAERSKEFEGLAERLWRARARVERGDLIGAEPLLEEVFPLVAGRQGPTPLFVARSLLKCRLSRGAVASSLPAFIAAVAARADQRGGKLEDSPAIDAADLVSDWGGDQASELGPLFDASTGLAPMLPPIWLNVASTQAIARDVALAAPMEGAPPRAQALARLYVAAARFEAGLPFEELIGLNAPDAMDISASVDPGVALIRMIVIGRVGNPSQRSAMRAAMLDRIKKRPPPWQEAWLRVAIGRSLSLELNREAQYDAIVQFAHLPARLERTQPYLAGIALAETAAMLLATGDTEGAQRVRDDFAARLPGHPALDWSPLREVGPRATPQSVPSPATPPAAITDDAPMRGPDVEIEPSTTAPRPPTK